MPDDVRRAATRMAAACADRLGIRQPSVRFYAGPGDAAWGGAAPADGEPIAAPSGAAGFYDRKDPDSVFLRATASPDRAAWLAAHECRHAWQHRTNGAAMEAAGAGERGRIEADADKFADAMMREFDEFNDRGFAEP